MNEEQFYPVLDVKKLMEDRLKTSVAGIIRLHSSFLPELYGAEQFLEGTNLNMLQYSSWIHGLKEEDIPVEELEKYNASNS